MCANRSFVVINRKFTLRRFEPMACGELFTFYTKYVPKAAADWRQLEKRV